MLFFGDAFGLPLVQKEAIERQGQEGGGIEAPEIGDLKQAIGEFLYASPSPLVKKPMTAFWHLLKSSGPSALTLGSGMPPSRMT